ncbi:hypothetical protein BCAR13_80138 [Paraburkholderia caribensis]|nr:hypothetical protein BCAR13_80138 [Paraburkholderia caribensis]
MILASQTLLLAQLGCWCIVIDCLTNLACTLLRTNDHPFLNSLEAALGIWHFVDFNKTLEADAHHAKRRSWGGRNRRAAKAPNAGQQ